MFGLNEVGTSNAIALVLVFVTGIYVVLTWRIANANQAMLKRADEQHVEAMRPLVYAYLEVREQIVVRLVIENLGKTPAYDLQINIDKDFYQFGHRAGRNIRDFQMFNEPINWFPPKARVLIDLTQGFNLDKMVDEKNITPSQFSLNICYRSKFGDFTEKCDIDISPYRNMHFPKTSSEHLGEIEKHLRRI